MKCELSVWVKLCYCISFGRMFFTRILLYEVLLVVGGFTWYGGDGGGNLKKCVRVVDVFVDFLLKLILTYLNRCL